MQVVPRFCDAGEAWLNSLTLFRVQGSSAPGRWWTCWGLDWLAVRRCPGTNAPMKRRVGAEEQSGRRIKVLLHFASCQITLASISEAS